MLLHVATAAGAGPDEAVAAGRAAGTEDADALAGLECVDALVLQMAEMGFDPALVDSGARSTMAFTHCPFRELAEAQPGLICSLHRGLTEGMVDALGGGTVVAFRSLVDRDACQVDIRRHDDDVMEPLAAARR